MPPPADTDPLNAGSPETPPTSPASLRPVGPAVGRRRLAAVLRLVLTGSVVAALLGPLPLADWAAQRPLLAESSAVQTVIEGIQQVHATVGFSLAYEWLRRRTRALQALRFNADRGNQ